MRRAYVFRFAAHRPPACGVGGCVDAHRELYNAALQERRDAWSDAIDADPMGDRRRSRQRYAVRPDRRCGRSLVSKRPCGGNSRLPAFSP